MNEDQEISQQEYLAQVQQLEIKFKEKLSKDARGRFGNIKAANPEMAVQIMLTLSQYIVNVDNESISDEKFKAMLQKMMPKKKNINITRK